MQKNQLYKGSLSTIILKLLSEHGKMYGYQITREVEKITAGELIITEGALYPALHKLEATELLSIETVEVNGRTRKYYYITNKGRKETISLLEEMRLYIENMQILLDPKII